MGSSSRRLLNQSTPGEGGELDGFERAPRSAPMDHLGFVESVDRLGEGIVVAVADTADGRFDACLGETFCVANADVLGGFNRSSQHLNEGVCDGHSKATITPFWTSTVAVTGTAGSSGAI